MPDINLNIICRCLHLNPANKLVVQKRRNFVLKRVAIIEAEIDKLLAAGFIKEVSYSKWLANVVLVVERENGNWPFLEALKKGHKDKWDDKCEVAFQNLKTYLTLPPILSKLIPCKDLYIYLAASDLTVNSALIREELGAQHPLHVDGASNQKGAGADVVIIIQDGTLLEQVITLGFLASNNEAEYEALLAGLCVAKELTIKKLAIYSDSQLIMNQASGEYMAKHLRMILYLDKVQELLNAFPTFTIQRVPWAENAHADALPSLGSALDIQFRRFILVEHLDLPSNEEIELIDTMQIDEDPNWQDPVSTS
ncbi:uncharacterized protein LOC117635261 [Prunus dulcis]|uniref:uncharacterized protein LOC117635261 n=1 Tax=Prunus dulcis TaxID=3755 RepID=UPI001482595E|nr:uncharacterized protein LOC117635261 [Prunus dulcis]